jgi:hypothetical protein
MSPHQRELILVASVVKSRRIGSARAAAAGSGIVVFPPLGRLPAQPGSAHQPGDALAAVAAALPAQLGVHHRSVITSLGPLMHGPDLAGELRVVLLTPAGPGAVGVIGGTGDLQQLARPLDVAPASLLRLDERIHRHRVSLAKKPSPA